MAASGKATKDRWWYAGGDTAASHSWCFSFAWQKEHNPEAASSLVTSFFFMKCLFFKAVLKELVNLKNHMQKCVSEGWNLCLCTSDILFDIQTLMNHYVRKLLSWTSSLLSHPRQLRGVPMWWGSVCSARHTEICLSRKPKHLSTTGAQILLHFFLVFHFMKLKLLPSHPADVKNSRGYICLICYKMLGRGADVCCMYCEMIAHCYLSD